MNTKMRNISLYGGIAFMALFLSQLIGYWVNSSIEINSSLEINSFIHFTHIRNYGGIFGLGQGMGWLFGLISITLLIAVSAYLWIGKNIYRFEYICFGFIVGGCASNILDRLVFGSGIDFIDIQHIPYWIYVFNTADVMVHVGIWPMLLFSFLSNPSEKHS